jgi:hypothetical protein
MGTTDLQHYQGISQSVYLQFKHNVQEGSEYSLGIALPKEISISFRRWPNGLQQPQDTFFHQVWT